MKIIDLKERARGAANAEKIQAIDVRDKMLFIYLPGEILTKYKGGIEWEIARKAGARAVVFVPDHMRIQDFNDEDLKMIGLQRIPPPVEVLPADLTEALEAGARITIEGQGGGGGNTEAPRCEVKLEFTPEDFARPKEVPQDLKDFEAILKAWAGAAAQIANARLQRMLEAAPVVVGVPGRQDWYEESVKTMKDTHRARLVCVEAIPK
jgi:hypothetical protein